MIQVGQEYDVPCLKVGYSAGPSTTPGNYGEVIVKGWRGFQSWVPLLNPMSRDEDFITSTVGTHAHVDWRFASDEEMDYECVSSIKPILTVVCDFSELLAKHGYSQVVETRKLVCQREFPGLRLLSLTHYRTELEAKYKDAVLDTHCPHKGVPREAMIRVGSALVCPAHGLRWDFNTGALLLTT